MQAAEVEAAAHRLQAMQQKQKRNFTVLSKWPPLLLVQSQTFSRFGTTITRHKLTSVPKNFLRMHYLSTAL